MTYFSERDARPGRDGADGFEGEPVSEDQLDGEAEDARLSIRYGLPQAHAPRSHGGLNLVKYLSQKSKTHSIKRKHIHHNYRFFLQFGVCRGINCTFVLKFSLLFSAFFLFSCRIFCSFFFRPGAYFCV